MKIGDVSRRRRLADPVRQAWYAYCRSLRFAQRMRNAQIDADAKLHVLSIVEYRSSEPSALQVG
jgi:hypothetical protein